MNFYILRLVLASLGLIAVSGVFILFISALSFCRKARLEKEKEKKYKAVLKTLENPHNILLACRLWSNIFKIISVIVVFNLFFFSMAVTENPYMGGHAYLTHTVDHTYVRQSDLFKEIFFVASILVLGLTITLLGDALPKLLSRTKPEKIAAALLPVMKFFSFFMLPFTLPSVKFASFFNSKTHPEIDDNSYTEEELQDELRNTLIEGEKSGVVESKERDMVEGVFYLGDRPVGAFMTHRSEIQWLDINAPYDEIREKAIEHRDQRCFPVVNERADEIIGAVYLEDIILDYAEKTPLGLRAIMKKAQFVPETMPAIKAFESFKNSQSNFLFVMDEYGGLAGIISITDLFEEIVGELSVPVADEEPLFRQEDGTYLADGTLNIDDAAKALSIVIDGEGEFHTLAGLILHLAGELPKIGDSFEYQGYKFKVVDKDGNRIDKLLISKIE